MSKALRCFTLILFMAGAVSLGAPATASPVTWLLQGSVSVSNLPGAPIGSPASMLLSFESSAADSEPDPGCGLYLGAILSASATFGSQTFNSGPNPTSGIEVSTGAGTVIACGITPGNFSAYTYRTFGAAPPLVAFFEGGPILTDALILTPRLLANSGFRLNVPGGPVGPSAIARIESAQVVPEPATLVLLGTGIASVLRMRQRRRD